VGSVVEGLDPDRIGPATPDVDRDTWASSSVANVSSTAVAEVLPHKTWESVVVPVAVLDAFAEEPKCKVSTVLNNGV